MKISGKAWAKYISDLRAVNDKAASEMVAFMKTIDFNTDTGRRALLDYAYAISQKYGSAAAELACEMYDSMGILSGMVLDPAVPADLATYGEVAKAVNGTIKFSENLEEIAGSVSRLVKMAGVDTTMNNAIRDGAEWAWIPQGETCAFCITLASRGWQPASRKAMKGGHAEHIHANCDCTYAIRFNSGTDVQGYDPDKYYEMYKDAAPGKNSKAKINAMRREFYAENSEKINEQKRDAYQKQKERESSAAEETNVN